MIEIFSVSWIGLIFASRWRRNRLLFLVEAGDGGLAWSVGWRKRCIVVYSFLWGFGEWLLIEISCVSLLEVVGLFVFGGNWIGWFIGGQRFLDNWASFVRP